MGPVSSIPSPSWEGRPTPTQPLCVPSYVSPGTAVPVLLANPDAERQRTSRTARPGLLSPTDRCGHQCRQRSPWYLVRGGRSLCQHCPGRFPLRWFFSAIQLQVAHCCNRSSFQAQIRFELMGAGVLPTPLDQASSLHPSEGGPSKPRSMPFRSLLPPNERGPPRWDHAGRLPLRLLLCAIRCQDAHRRTHRQQKGPNTVSFLLLLQPVGFFTAALLPSFVPLVLTATLAFPASVSEGDHHPLLPICTLLADPGAPSPCFVSWLQRRRSQDHRGLLWTSSFMQLPSLAVSSAP
ncbi:hypothetical protein NDU88_001370 [Pleurodeles waltl]|uniref:Uncharacterized protein n=1 Tax=Pleurodeles waltl TaxID=8319 RepID=A0AAV7Q3T3_PLEWA|nr:hypothetical protein NDU88_001370 [Pleurodeles waltl]